MEDKLKLEFDNADVNKASKWTIYFLVDLKAVFIITYAYITVVSLISDTADSEATRDAKSMAKFNITTHPSHQEVEVEFIDDAVLWNCRDKSVTKHYYRGLYWMLTATTVAILFVFMVVKLYIVLAASHGHIYLWRLAVLEHLHEKLDTCTHHDLDALCYNRLLLQSELEIKVPKCTYYFRVVALIYSVIILPIAISLSALSYDLHPLSCITGTAEDTISYNETAKAVEIRYSDHLLLFQKISVGIVGVLATNFLIIILGFACLNYSIIKILKGQVNDNKIKIIREEIKKLEMDIRESCDTADLEELQSQILKLKKLLCIELKKSCEELQNLLDEREKKDKNLIEELSNIIRYRNEEIVEIKRNQEFEDESFNT
ncbi:uncharacterized protein [Dysidea avara]|uniref:uncharacterized protein n=1 Tax=Dysidea avara TaxID=196820 RepID=UPI003327B88F